MTFRTSTIFSSAPNMFITQKSESDNKSRLFSRKKTLILSNFFTVPSCPQHLHQNLYDFWRPRIQLGCRKLIQFNIIGNSRLLCCWNLFETIFCLLSARQRAKTWDFCSITKGTKKLNRFIERKRRNFEDRFRKTSHCRWSLPALTSKLMCHLDHLSMSIKVISNNLLCESETACPSYPFQIPLKIVSRHPERLFRRNFYFSFVF